MTAAQHAGPNASGWVVIALLVFAITTAFLLWRRNRRQP